MRLVATKVTEGTDFHRIFRLFSNSKRYVEYAHQGGRVFWAFYLKEKSDYSPFRPQRNQGILHLSEFSSIVNTTTIKVSSYIPPMRIDGHRKIRKWRQLNVRYYQGIQSIRDEYYSEEALVG